MSETLPILSPSCSEQEFIRIMRDVVKLNQATTLWMTDACAWAVAKWGEKDGIAIAVKAAGIEEYSVKKRLTVAAAFPPEKRFDGYEYAHYRRMIPFPVGFRDAFMEKHAGEGHSSRILRSMAAAEFGADKTQPKKKKQLPSQPNRQVGIPDELYVRLRPFSSQKVAALVIRIIEEWLSKQPDAPAPETKRARHIHEVNERRAERQNAREEKATAKQDKAVARQKAREVKAAAKAQMHEAKRASYATRRQAMLDAGAQRFAAKQKKTKNEKLRIAFVDCKPDQFIDDEGGPKPYSARSKAATAFRSEADAIAAEQKYAAEKGYRARVVRCPVCSGGSARGPVWHLNFVYPVLGRDGNYYPKVASDAVAQTDVSDHQPTASGAAGEPVAQEKTAR